MAMFGQRTFDSCWRPAGAGANYAYLTDSVENEVFHKDAENTIWKQDFQKYTPFQMAVIVQGLQNAGAGKNMTAQLTKTPDLLYDSYTVSGWYGIKANCECGVTKASYVNARALYANKCAKLKIATQTLFESDGLATLVYMELMGLLDDYASMVGFYYTKEQLIEDSRWDSVLFAPWHSLYPGQGRPDLTYAIGTIAFHPFTFEQQNRGIHELVVNYDGVHTKGRGLFALPIEINTGALVSSSTVDFTLATTNVWVSCEERLALLNGYNEIIFKEHIKAGEHHEGPSCNEKTITFDLNLKGPVAYIWVIAQSTADIECGNWIKTFDDYGLDYISEIMLMTGSTAREDGLPAAFYRTAKVLETFKNSIRRAVYVFSFSVNEKCKYLTGHQTMTNCEKLQIKAVVKAHKCALQFTAYGAVYNGAYTECGGGGKVWG